MLFGQRFHSFFRWSRLFGYQILSTNNMQIISTFRPYAFKLLRRTTTIDPDVISRFNTNVGANFTIKIHAKHGSFSIIFQDSVAFI